MSHLVFAGSPDPPAAGSAVLASANPGVAKGHIFIKMIRDLVWGVGNTV